MPSVGQSTLTSVSVVYEPDEAEAGETSRFGFFRSVTFQLLAVEGTILAIVLSFMRILTSEFPTTRAIVRLAVAVGVGIFGFGALIEAIAAIKRPIPRGHTALNFPPTTAIIPAYLPNEESIILDTIEQHLRAGPPDLQLIVAYNTPRYLPVEADLAMMAANEPRLLALKVEHSTSKAANVNAALGHATGEIIAVFDCDHYPAPGNYERAWQWLSNGADVVQGRCVIRSPEGAGRPMISKIVAAEFEQMYTVGHPGRARVLGFGLFGGSNGYWRADSLRAVKLDPSALTEDIDASVRLLRSGGRIVSDPGIVSAELAPPTMRALCHQRMRWGQGWFQVTRRHLASVVTDRQISIRQRLGAAWVFGFGTLMAWVGALVLPLSLAGWISHEHTATSPITSALFAFGTVAFVVQIAVAYRHALPDSRRPSVFASYVIANIVFYGYLRVALVRLSHLHELMGLNRWRVTPRARSESRRGQSPRAVDVASAVMLDHE